MPQLRQKHVVKVTLPSFADEKDPAIVEIETPATMGDFEDLQLEGNESQLRQSAMVLTKKIKAWNLTDDKGKTIEINVDNVLLMDAVDFGTLTITLGLDKLVQQLSLAKKKTLSATSQA